MKKILSILLVLTLCLGLFAACDTKPTEPATSDLANAKQLLSINYKPSSKDEIPVKSADFELMTSVTVDGVSYPVEWTVAVTAGPADAVKLDGNKVDLTEKPAEEVKFTLTATIKDAKGNSETASFNFMTPAFEAPTADKVVILNVADNKYATGTEYEYTSSSGNVKMELTLTDNKAEALAYTMVNNDDGTVSFQTDCGKYLYCDANSVEFATEMGDYTKFILDAAEGGYYIKCAVANYSGKPQYLEIYSGYLTCYGMSETSNLDLYIFALEDAEGANGTVVEYDPSSAPETTAPETTAPAGGESSDPAADSTLSISEAIALGASKAHNTYTDGKYYVTGVITEVYNEQYGNMKLTDDAGNILTIYGTYDADGTNRYDAMAAKPVAGDTVTIYGIVGQYNDVPQIKNGWITAHTPGAGAPEVPETTAPAAPETTAPSTGSEVNVVTAPVAGTAYKFYLFHATNNAPMFLTGNTANKEYYLESTTDASAAIDVYLEEANGGYYLYFNKDGAKTYIDIIVSGTYINIKLASAPNAVYTWNSEYNTLTTTVTVDGTETGAYIGAYGTYTTFSASKASYMGQSGSFCANLVTVG